MFGIRTLDGCRSREVPYIKTALFCLSFSLSFFLSFSPSLYIYILNHVYTMYVWIISSYQPLWKMRNYFGEEVALFFAWTGADPNTQSSHALFLYPSQPFPLFMPPWLSPYPCFLFYDHLFLSCVVIFLPFIFSS